LKDYESKLTAYYDSLTEEDRKENRAWASLGAQEATARDFGEPLE